MRRDGIFGLVGLIFVDAFLENAEDPGGNVEGHRQEEGSSHREKDWKRLSLRRSTRRRVDTWLGGKGSEEMYISEERDLGVVRMAVMRARSALPDS